MIHYRARSVRSCAITIFGTYREHGVEREPDSYVTLHSVRDDISQTEHREWEGRLDDDCYRSGVYTRVFAGVGETSADVEEATANQARDDDVERERYRVPARAKYVRNSDEVVSVGTSRLV